MKVVDGWRGMALRLTVFILALSVVLLLFERHLIYFPSRALEVTPGQVGIPFEDVSLTTEDGVRLHAWLLPVKHATLTVLLCHGNGGNISHRLDRAMLLQAKLGTSVFLFDYRGYGVSQGRPDEAGTYADARAAYRYLAQERGLSPERLVLFGESLGSAVALRLALERPARALILESAFTSISDMARATYPFLPLWPFVRTRYDSLGRIPSLRMPLLVLHGDRDSLVPLEQGRRLYEAAPQPKRFFAIPGANHNDTYVAGGEAYWRVIQEFVASLPAASEHPD